MTRVRMALATFALSFSLAAPLQGQRVTLELRLAGAAPLEELAGADLETGLGFGGTVALRLQEHTHVYGGWDWLHFRADQSFAGTDRDFEETGYTAGLRFEHPLTGTSALLYRIEAGGSYKHVEIESEDGDLIADSGHGLGFEAGAGVVFPLGESWRLSPMLRFRTLAPEFDIGAATVTGDLRYVALELGLSHVR
jgi:hypothetical protein